MIMNHLKNKLNGKPNDGIMIEAHINAGIYLHMSAPHTCYIHKYTIAMVCSAVVAAVCVSICICFVFIHVGYAVCRAKQHAYLCIWVNVSISIWNSNINAQHLSRIL